MINMLCKKFRYWVSRSDFCFYGNVEEILLHSSVENANLVRINRVFMKWSLTHCSSQMHLRSILHLSNTTQFIQ